MADITITAANVLMTSADTTTGIAGETITAGMPVYLKSTDARYWKAQCDGTAAEATAVGIALHASLAGQPLTIATGGTINIGATTAKVFYYLSATAGGIAPVADLTSGQYIVALGYATTTGGAFVVKPTYTGATV